MIRFFKDVRAHVQIAREDLIARARTLGRRLPTRAETLAVVNRIAEQRGCLDGSWANSKVGYLAQGTSWEPLVQRSIETDPRYRYIAGEDLRAAHTRHPQEAEELLGDINVLFLYPFIGYQDLLPWLRLKRFVFHITWDDTFHFYREEMSGYAQRSDCLLSQTPKSARRYLSIDVPWLQFVEGGAASSPPVRRPDRFSLSYVGNLSGKRKNLIRHLESIMGDAFEVYGPGSRRGPVSASQAVEIQKSTSASLAISDLGRGFGITHFKCRHFEIPCNGGLMLAEYTDGLETMFDLDREALCYWNLKDFMTKVSWIRDHPDEAWNIRLGGYRRAAREHTWIARFRGLLMELDAVRELSPS